MIVFSFSMMCGGIWEIYEYVTDGLLGNNAQVFEGFVGRDAIRDTMLDLVCDFAGAVAGGVLAVFLEKKKAKQAKQAENAQVRQVESAETEIVDA